MNSGMSRLPIRQSLGLRCEGGSLWILDQSLLPSSEVWIEIRDCEHMAECIGRLAVRGAPLIGISAALALAMEAVRGTSIDKLREKALILRRARPTAVNLMHAIDRIARLEADQMVESAVKIFDEDRAMCEAMAERAAAKVNDGDRVITHCNTGGLVTAGIGTALGAIKKAAQQGKRLHVYIDETRPLLQGSRLNTWELKRDQIPFTVICDNMAGFLMSQKQIAAVFVGADRIAKNGDVANKIGTYSLAIAARYHQVPFYVVAPETTFDQECESGKNIPIETRKSDEIIKDCEAWNPAFDITPRDLITKIITDSREY